jgi:hypothetical protein
VTVKYQIPVRNALTIEKARRMVEALQARVSSGEITAPDDLLSNMYEVFHELFANLRKPMTKALELKLAGVRSYNDIIKFLDIVAADLDVLSDGAHTLTDAAVESFNLAVVRNKILQDKINKAQSMSADLQLINDDMSNAVIVVGDDFCTPDRMDLALTSDIPCEVLPGGLGVSLAKAGVMNVVDAAKAKVTVTPSSDAYEGRYYAPLGEAEPEGRSFRWTSEKVKKSRGAGKGGGSRRGGKRFGGGGAGNGKATHTYTAGSGTPQKGVTTREAEPASPSIRDTKYSVEHAPEEELLEARLRILDGDVDTYWQIEVAQKSRAMLHWQKAHERESADAEESGVEPPVVTMSDIEDAVTKLGSKGDPLDVTIVIDLGQESPSNWVALIPLNFHDGAWLEILTVETAGADGVFTALPDLGDMNETILTPEANEDLSPDEVAAVLSNTKNFAGQGLWAFPIRMVQFVRFKLRQSAFTPCPYSVYHTVVEQDYVASTKTRVVKKSYGRASRKTTTDTEENTYSRKLKLDYARSMMIASGDYALNQLMTGKEGQASVKKEHHWKGGVKSKDTTITVETTPVSDWHMTDKHETPMYDVVRRAIGIRDITVNRYTYKETSELVSVPFDVPNPIMKVGLVVNEHISEELKAVDADEPWIKYYISFDAATWHQITPISDLHNMDDLAIPSIINVNSDLSEDERSGVEGYVDTGEDTYSLRLKAVLSRPPGDDNDALGPILKNYRLRVFCRGSL